jgi:hypothetical protein
VLTSLLALCALIIAIMHGTARGARVAPLWVAIALLAVGMMIPWLLTMSLR